MMGGGMYGWYMLLHGVICMLDYLEKMVIAAVTWSNSVCKFMLNSGQSAGLAGMYGISAN